MRQGNGTVLKSVMNNGGDAVASLAVVGVWGEVIPIVFGALGAFWFCLRFVNFVRVNFFNKEPWRMNG